MSRRTLIIIGVLVFLLALVSRIPAATALGWAYKLQPGIPVVLHTPTGTLWHGESPIVSVRNQPVLQDFSWKLHPLSALIGRLSLDLQSTSGPIRIDGSLSSSFSGASLHAENLHGEAPLGMIAAMTPYRAFKVDGSANLAINTLTIRDGVPIELDGRALVQGIAIQFGRSPIQLGDYNIVAAQDGDDVVAKISSVRGPVSAQGEVRVKPDASWQLQLEIKPQADADPMIANLLRNTGKPNAQGAYVIHQSGTLPTASKSDEASDDDDKKDNSKDD